MNITQLKYFKALYECKSYTRAAEQSFVSQPALSIAIRKLEGELGVELFNKDGQKVSVTDEGNALYPLVNRVLSDVDSIYLESRRASDDNTYQLKIAVPQDIGVPLILSIKEYFRKNDKNAKPVILQYRPDDLMRELMSGSIDVCIAPESMIPEDMPRTKITSEELCVLVSGSHPFTANGKVTPQMLAGHTVITAPGSSDITALLESWAQENRAAVPIFSEDKYDRWTAVQMLDNSSAAVFPRSSIPFPGCHELPLGPPLRRDLVLVRGGRNTERISESKLADLAESFTA